MESLDHVDVIPSFIKKKRKKKGENPLVHEKAFSHLCVVFLSFIIQEEVGGSS